MSILRKFSIADDIFLLVLVVCNSTSKALLETKEVFFVCFVVFFSFGLRRKPNVDHSSVFNELVKSRSQFCYHLKILPS